MTRHVDEEASAAEARPRALEQRRPERGVAAGERDEPLGVRLELLPAHAGLALGAARVPEREQATQIPVARGALDEQQQGSPARRARPAARARRRPPRSGAGPRPSPPGRSVARPRGRRDRRARGRRSRGRRRGRPDPRGSRRPRGRRRRCGSAARRSRGAGAEGASGEFRLFFACVSSACDGPAGMLRGPGTSARVRRGRGRMASIVVVGGGIAGLACAWRLRRAGHDVEVLEREAEAAAACAASAHGAFVLDRGAQFIASGYRNLHAVARAVGLEDRVRRVARSDNAILRDGRLHGGDYGNPLRLLALAPALRAREGAAPAPALRGRAPPARARSAAPRARRRARSRGSRDRSDPAGRRRGLRVSARARASPRPSTAIPRISRSPSRCSRCASSRAASACSASRAAWACSRRRSRARCRCARAARRSRSRPRATGARVRYRARGRESSVLADAAVVALPGSLVAGVCPKLTPDERGFFEHVRYVRGMIVHLMFEQAPATLPYYGVAFPRREGLDLYGLAVDHHKPGVAPPGAGLVNAALTARAAARALGRARRGDRRAGDREPGAHADRAARARGRRGPPLVADAPAVRRRLPAAPRALPGPARALAAPRLRRGLPGGPLHRGGAHERPARRDGDRAARL